MTNRVRGRLPKAFVQTANRRAANLRPIYGVTVKFVALLALPPGVVIEILLVTTPAGTVAVTCVSEFTTNAAFLLPKVTFVA